MEISRRKYLSILLGLLSTILLLAGSLVWVVFNGGHTGILESKDTAAKASITNLVKTPLSAEEGVLVLHPSDSEEELVPQILPVEKILFEYIEVTGGCGAHFEGECLNARSGPGTEYPAVAKLRNGMVLKAGGMVVNEGEEWYKIVFDEWLRYPDRIKGDWYVSADYVQILYDEGSRTVWEHEYSTTTAKSIVVDRSDQKLYAYDGEKLFVELSISTGLELTPTPRGTFTIYKKTPSRYMQGPLPNLVDKQYYDLPGVPWNLYFTEGGAVIHGAYWHESFGRPYSHGCVNILPSEARNLYEWATLGTKVIVRD